MTRRVHLVGIGGAGMSAIARVLHQRGEVVTGSDLQASAFSLALEAQGVLVNYGHKAENIAGAQLLLVSSAVPDENQEVKAAHAAGIPVLRRADFLGELTANQKTIAVAGTHGKTTTASLIAWILEQAGHSPGFILGGVMKGLDTNANAGGGELFVIEADEYGRAFLGLRPSIAVVTNVEHDHPDEYPTPEDFAAVFQQFVQKVRDVLVVCLDDPGAAALEKAGIRRTSYGLEARADWRAEEIRVNQAGGSDFLVVKGSEVLGLVQTRLPGPHNVNNTLGALAVTSEIGVPFSRACEALASFQGTERRFEIVAEISGVTIVDDYAHHPTEVRATLAAARARFPDRRIWAVFQPHTYSRTRAFLDQLVEAFADADCVLVTEIFPARETPDPAVDGKRLADSLNHPEVRFAADNEEASRVLLEEVRSGEVVLILSAGDGDQIGLRLLEGLRFQEVDGHDG